MQLRSKCQQCKLPRLQQEQQLLEAEAPQSFSTDTDDLMTRVDALLEEKNRPMVLEVEVPEDDLARRRIGFYERHGLVYNDYPYLQPPLRKGNELLPLRLMTKPTAIDETTYERYKKRMYAVVYKYEG